MLTQESGRIVAPDANNDGFYDNGISCYWSIEGLEGEQIKFELVFVRMEESRDCMRDTLMVRTLSV